jgi:hypothetical protein
MQLIGGMLSAIFGLMVMKIVPANATIAHLAKKAPY